MNRATRRRQRTAELPDPRPWDHEPRQLLRWTPFLRITLPPDSEIERDMEYAEGKDIGFTYNEDGTKTMRVGTREATLPSRESVLAALDNLKRPTSRTAIV